MPYGPFDTALSSVTAAYLDRLVSDGVPEGYQLEYKEGFSEKGGSQNASGCGDWAKSEKAKRALARAVVGFANADGGTLIVGVRETQDRPPRLEAIVPLLDVTDPADRVGSALLDLIDPRPDRLEVAGVPTDGDAGVLIIRTPPSLNAPHRVKTKDTFGIFVRRGDKTVEATMREVHDIVLRRETGVERFERMFQKARDAFEARMAGLRAGRSASVNGGPAQRSAVGWSIHVAPITRAAVDLGAIGSFPGGAILANGKEWAGEATRDSLRRAVPILGGRTYEDRNQFGDNWPDVRSTWFRDCRGEFLRVLSWSSMGEVAAIRPALLSDPLLNAMIWIRAVREHSGDPGLAFGLQVCVDNLDGARMVSEWSGDRHSQIMPAAAASAIYEVGPPGALNQTVAAVMRDAAGAFGDELHNREFTLRWEDDAEA